MKVVLFCGGFGMRLRETSQSIPKPLVRIGYRPLLWHLMKYYAHYGHNEFILCLGHQGDVIKDYFLNYDECVSNDFTLSRGGELIELMNRDLDDWTITFAETGQTSNIGERLKAVESYVAGEEVFLANYSDNLTDFHLPLIIDDFAASEGVASFLSVRPSQTFHIVKMDTTGEVKDIRDVRTSDTWINGGYFVFRKTIFDYMRQGEELVLEPFSRLMKERKLRSYRYDGFWACMDTHKDKAQLDDMYARGNPLWQVWTAAEKPASVCDD